MPDSDRRFRRHARRSVRSFRRATAPLRMLPGALLIGAQKAGTTSLFRYLARHPRVRPAFPKEPDFFDKHHHRGVLWYRSHFPLRRPAAEGGAHVAIEASTGTICHPLAPERVQRLLPDVRLVALLRDPADRAWSHYHHTVRLGREGEDFERAIRLEEARLRDFRRRFARDPSHYDKAFNHYTYLSRGHYARQLRPWLERFGRERLLVLTTEGLRRDPRGTVRRVLRFLGLEPEALPEGPFQVHNRGTNKVGPMPAATRALLTEHYRPHRRELRELLGHDPWEEEAEAAPAGIAVGS